MWVKSFIQEKSNFLQPKFRKLILSIFTLTISCATFINAAIIYCDYELSPYVDVSNCSILPEVYICANAEVHYFVFTSDDIMGVSTKHLPGKSYEDVQIISFADNQKISRIPVGLEKFFPNLIGISMYHNDLQNLTSEDLSRFPKLRFVNVPQDKLDSLHNEVIQFDPNVESLDLGEKPRRRMDNPDGSQSRGWSFSIKLFSFSFSIKFFGLHAIDLGVLKERCSASKQNWWTSFLNTKEKRSNWRFDRIWMVLLENGKSHQNNVAKQLTHWSSYE